MKRLSRLVLKIYTFQLAVVFEKFVNGSLKGYGFCQSHYFSVYTLDLDVMLNFSKVKLKHISDAGIMILKRE